MVAPLALAWNAPASAPAARVRLWDMAAQVSQAALAGQAPHPRPRVPQPPPVSRRHGGKRPAVPAGRECPMSGNGITRIRAARSRPPFAGTWLRPIRRSSAACAVLTAAVLAAAMGACGTRPAPGGRGAHHGPARAVLTATFRLPGILGVATGAGRPRVQPLHARMRPGSAPATDRSALLLSR